MVRCIIKNVAEQHQNYQKANFWERLLATLIDFVIILLLNFVIYWLLISKSDLSPSIKEQLPELIVILIWVLYSVFFLSATGATIGKRILRLKVLDKNYCKVSLPRILLRETIAKFLSHILELGYLWILIDKKKQAWHDKITGTCVVKLDSKQQLIPGENAASGTKDRIAFGIFLIISALYTLGVVYVTVHTVIAEQLQFDGDAMLPSYPNGQKFVTDKFSSRVKFPSRGDVIVFKSPLQKNKKLAKRVIGLPGEEIKIDGGRVYINQVMLSEPYLARESSTSAGIFFREGETFLIPSNAYIVLGDNRGRGADSSVFGAITRESILGKLWFTY